MTRVIRMLAIDGVLALLIAAVLAWQGQREWPLYLGGAGVLLLIPALHRAHRRSTHWSKALRDRVAGMEL